MTASTPSTEPEQSTPEGGSESAPDEETVKGWVREGIHEVMGELGLSNPSGGGTSTPPADGGGNSGGHTEKPAGPISIKDIEDAATRAVETAMAPLREAKPKERSKPKAAEKPAEPEPAPTAPNRLRKVLWG